MNEPEKRYEVGSICAAIYVTESMAGGERKTFRSVRLQRTFRDREGKMQVSSWLNQNDVPKAIMALQKAYEHLVTRGASRGAMGERRLPTKPEERAYDLRSGDGR